MSPIPNILFLGKKGWIDKINNNFSYFSFYSEICFNLLDDANI